MFVVTLPSPPWHRPAKSPAPRRTLSRDAIVDAAMRVLDKEGTGGLSMRRVAQELDTGPASLYAHVSNREELEELLFDRILGEVPIPTPDPARWQDQLKQLIRDAEAAFVRHRAARLALARMPFTPNGLINGEAALALLRCGGIPDQVAAYAVDLLSLYSVAHAMEASVYADKGVTEEQNQERFQQVRGYLEELPPDRFPVMTSMVDQLLAGDGEERFEFGLDVLIRGLIAVGQGTPAPGKTAAAPDPR